MKNRIALMSLGLVLLAIAAVIPALISHTGGRTAQAVSGSVGFAPASSTITLGVTPVPTVDLSVTNASGVAGYEAWVTFNGSVVQLTSLQDAGFLGNPNAQGTPQNAVVCNTPTMTASYGHIACSVLAFPSPFPPPVLPSAGATPAALVHASFSSIAAGTSPLGQSTTVSGTPESTTLLDINDTPIAASLGTGNITVIRALSVGGVAEAPDVRMLPTEATRAPSNGLRHGVEVTLAVVAATTVGIVGGGQLRRRQSHYRRRRS